MRAGRATSSAHIHTGTHTDTGTGTRTHRGTTQTPTQLEPHNRSRIGSRMLSSVEAMRFHCELRACSLSPPLSLYLPLCLSACAWRSKNFRKLLLHERFGAARRQGTAKVVVKRKLRRLQKELGNVANCIKNLQPEHRDSWTDIIVQKCSMGKKPK